MGWYYNLIVALGGLIIGVFGLTDELAKNNKFLSSLNSVIFKIAVYIIGGFMILWGTVSQSLENANSVANDKKVHENDIRKLDSTYRNERKISDSLYEVKIQSLLDSSYSKSIKSSNEALAKYNLTLIDSMNTVVSKVNKKNSIAQLAVQSVIEDKSPIYTQTVNGKKSLFVKFESKNGTIYNAIIRCYICQSSNNGLKILQVERANDEKFFLVEDRFRTLSFQVSSITKNLTEVFIVLIGEFSRDESGLQIEKYSESFVYDFLNDKLIGRSNSSFLKEFQEYVNKNNID